ncbi:protein COFACTOR ASSEMBLY OF COMPLEX C SUBUNIT B CCB2, chloroplastic [Henckelia pumila]|uniref:protein COFACTOR ASSEMBLY OF COMPLEX C SUBUNIT B CCB2, chloroplastic n=1 Tax=Henckelia pumila TaxID=405737 RepID=UPI003C6E4256
MSAGVASLFLIPFITTRAKSYFPSKFIKNRSSWAAISCSRNAEPQQQQQQLNLSVLRFTLGIPGLDESYLPRYIGYTFGALLLLNHFVGSDSSSITPAQLRTEALGLSLAAFSVCVPYIGRFLKGATPIDQKNIIEGVEQIFLMSPNMADTRKEDLAWGTYVLLRNTNSISVLISVQNELCVRGYWNVPKDLSKENASGWFEKQIEKIGFSNLKGPLYFQQATDSALMGMVPEGVRSLLVQPILQNPNSSSEDAEKSSGFVLLASSIDYAYGDKDKAWIAAIANKFRG